MEDKTYGTLVTDCGIQLIAAAVMEGKKINITDQIGRASCRERV